MEKLIDDYLEKFGEQFPIMLLRGVSEEELKAIIQKCIDEGKPYEPELIDKALY